MARPISAEIPTNTPEGRSAYMKDWWAKNREKKREYDKLYNSRHKESVAKQRKQYYEANKETVRAWMKQYTIDNKDKLMPGWQKHYRKRRALLAGVESEPYTQEEIFSKSGGVCHICRVGIDLSLKWPHPFSFSFDHVTPLSRGGSDLIINIEASHLRCNISKYVNPVKELV